MIAAIYPSGCGKPLYVLGTYSYLQIQLFQKHLECICIDTQKQVVLLDLCDDLALEICRLLTMNELQILACISKRAKAIFLNPQNVDEINVD